MASESRRSSSRNSQSGRCFFKIRSFSMMSTSKGLALLDSIDWHSEITRNNSSSFLSPKLIRLQFSYFRCPVDSLDGDDVRGLVEDGQNRGGDHEVLRTLPPLDVREDHLEHRLPILRVHVYVELVHRAHRRDYSRLQGEDEGHQGDGPLTAALRERVEGCRGGPPEADVELYPRFFDVAPLLQPDESCGIRRGEDRLVVGVNRLE